MIELYIVTRRSLTVDGDVQVLLADTMVKDGLTTEGLVLGVKNDRFEISYDVVSYSCERVCSLVLGSGEDIGYPRALSC